MDIELRDAQPFSEWLFGAPKTPGALLTWVGAIVCIALLALAVGCLLAVVRHGPQRGWRVACDVMRNAWTDLVFMSPRRIWALARLVIQESIRRRIVVVFAVFIVLLLFAGWYLDQKSDDPAGLYLNFVLTATMYLVLLLALFLSSLSLPTDIKNRTLYTVMTKPARASEVVLGRIVGFTVVLTVLLAVMGGISYVFALRGLAHTHTLSADNLQKTGKSNDLAGVTGETKFHRHNVTIQTIGTATLGSMETALHHTHAVEVKIVGGSTTYEVGPAEGMLQARVPVYGTVAYLDPTGTPTGKLEAKGVSVGYEDDRRGFVAGGGNAAIIWTFKDLSPERYPEGLPIELNIETYRTYKGDINQRISASLSVRNPRTNFQAVPHDLPVQISVFRTRDREADAHKIPLTFKVGDKDYDLFKDFVHDGELEIWLKCPERMQYIGAARGDMYLRASDNWFPWNFAKGYIGIWLQAVMVIAFGVTFSTFLSGPVAIVVTLGAVIAGFFNEFMAKLAAHQTFGGGPFESLYRMLTQENVTSQLPPGLPATVVQTLDQPSQLFLWLFSNVLPDFSRFSFSDSVAHGMDISNTMVLLKYACSAAAFVLPVFIVGYLCLRNREIAGRD